MKVNGKVMAIVCAGIMLIAGSAGAYAYSSTSAVTVNNTFRLIAGSQDQNDAGTIQESNWGDDDEHQNLQPNNVVPKNPTITSNVDYDAWVFLQIDIPAVLAAQDSDREEYIYPAVLLSYDGETEGFNSEDWMLIGSTEATSTDGTYIYYYGYKNPIAKDETTTELFRYIMVPDFTKIEYFEGSIDVTGYMIQHEGFDTLTDAAKGLGIIN